MRSLTGGDGAVSGVVVKSVEVFAALWAEIKRTWNVEEEQIVRAAGCQELGSGEVMRGKPTCKMFQKLVFHP